MATHNTQYPIVMVPHQIGPQLGLWTHGLVFTEADYAPRALASVQAPSESRLSFPRCVSGCIDSDDPARAASIAVLLFPCFWYEYIPP